MTRADQWASLLPPTPDFDDASPVKHEGGPVKWINPSEPTRYARDYLVCPLKESGSIYCVVRVCLIKIDYDPVIVVCPITAP
jgi:hypothetical protein